MKWLIACAVLCAGGCVTPEQRIATYDDARLCREAGRASAHSKQAYVVEAERRKLRCGAGI
jgi:hypothetical protein